MLTNHRSLEVSRAHAITLFTQFLQLSASSQFIRMHCFTSCWRTVFPPLSMHVCTLWPALMRLRVFHNCIFSRFCISVFYSLTLLLCLSSADPAGSVSSLSAKFYTSDTSQHPAPPTLTPPHYKPSISLWLLYPCGSLLCTKILWPCPWLQLIKLKNIDV